MDPCGDKEMEWREREGSDFLPGPINGLRDASSKVLRINFAAFPPLSHSLKDI